VPSDVGGNGCRLIFLCDSGELAIQLDHNGRRVEETLAYFFVHVETEESCLGVERNLPQIEERWLVASSVKR
jgi:hypothetical protein